MSEHTKGLLRLGDEERVLGADGRILRIAGVALAPGHRKGQRMFDEAFANRRRLIAIWNACEGIPTEDIERSRVIERPSPPPPLFPSDKDTLPEGKGNDDG